MRSYGKMVFLGGLLTREEVDGYYDKCMELARGRGDREEIYNTSARYYRDRGDYERSTAYMDSLLTHYAETGKKADLGSIYIAQSHLYEKAGDYAKALEAMRKGNDFRYHSRMDQAQSKLAEMQALYDVNRLELEKSRLADRNKLFLLVAGGIVLLLAGWAAYQQAMVRRLKLARTQFMAASEEAQRQSRRAQESEKMKTAFINSMCHEIRTPLNAINGFSELLLTEQKPAARQAFQAEIWKSTTALTALLLDGVSGGLAGAIGLALADILAGDPGYAVTTFVLKFIIGITCGAVAHKAFKLRDLDRHSAGYLVKVIVAAGSGLLLNVVTDPFLGYFRNVYIFGQEYTVAQALSKIAGGVTFVNSVASTACAVVLYLALRPALERSR